MRIRISPVLKPFLLLTTLIGMAAPASAAVVLQQNLSSADFTVDTALNVPNARFGESVAIAGNWMAVGTPGGNGGSGMVRIHERVAGAWVYRTQLLPPAAQAGSEFGAAVDVYEAGGLLTVIVGAPLFDSAQTDQGRAYIYSDTNAGAAFSFSTTTVNPATAEFNGQFGAAVALFADLAAIAAPNAGAADDGLVSIRGRNTGGTNAWGQSVTPKSGNLGNHFGTSIDLHGEYLIVGAPQASNSGGVRSGQVYVYRQDLGGANAWGIKHTLTPAVAESDMAFGRSVGIWDSNTGVADSASRSMVGAPMTDNGGFTDVGAVHFFLNATANFTHLHAAAAVNAHAHLGYSVALEGDEAIAGRPDQSLPGFELSGRVDTFFFGGANWGANTTNINQNPFAAGNGFGRAVDLSGTLAVASAPRTLSDSVTVPPGAALAGVVRPLAKQGGNWVGEVQFGAEFEQPNLSTNQSMGYATALTDEWMAVGVTGDGQKGANAGAVYMYRSVAGVWTAHSKLTALYGAAGDEFGKAVTLSGTKLVVGAPSFDGFPVTTSNSGAIYLFEFDGTHWVQKVERISPNPSNDGYFGYSLALHGDVLAVGAYRENGLVGRAYAYRDLADLSAPLTLNVSGLPLHSAAGWTVAAYDPAPGTANDEVIALGAPAANSTQGAAYVFSGANFTTVTPLVDPALGSGRFFGYAVSIFNGRVAVGAPSTSAAPSGGVVVFSGSGYSTATTLVRSTGAGEFGYSLDLDDGALLIGAPASNGSAGLATVFTRSGSSWTESGLLQPAVLASNDRAGSAVAMSGGQFLLGAPTHDANSIANAGAAFVYSQAPEVSVTPTTLSLAETGTTADTFVVALNQAPATNVTVQLTFDSAQIRVDAGSGFGVSPQTVTLTPANATTGVTVAARAVDDGFDELDPHAVSLTTAATASSTPQFNGLLVDDVAVSIADNDTAGVAITQTSGGNGISESGSTDTYSIVLGSQPSATVNMAISFPANELTVSGDTDGTFNTTFNAGNWSNPQTITIAAVNDRALEGNHAAAISHAFTSVDASYNGIVAIVDGGAASNALNVDITDNESAVLSWLPATVSAAEGANAISAVQLDITANPAGGTPVLDGSLSYSLSLLAGTAVAADLGTVTAATDFSSVSDLASNAFSIAHLDDALVEGNETYGYAINLNTPPAGMNVTVAPTSFSGTIVDTDVASLTLTGAASISEAVGTHPLTVTLNAGAGNVLQQAVSVTVNLVDGSATYAAGGGDFNFAGPASTATVNFPIGTAHNASQIVSVVVRDDRSVEGPEDFSASLGAVTGAATATGSSQVISIVDNDVATLSFATPTSTVSEDSTPHTVNALLTIVANGTGISGLATAVTVPVTQTPGTASAADYTVAAPSLNFPLGAVDGASQPISITIINDAIAEGTEDFSLGFGTVSGPATAAGTHVVSITDNEVAAVIITQSGGGTAVAEGGINDSYTITLGSEPTAAVNIAIGFSGSQLIVNGDTSNTVNVALNAGNWNTGVVVNVVAVDDTLIEANPHQSLLAHTISSSDPAYAALPAPAAVAVSIVENDQQEITFSTATSNVGEAAGTHNVIARLSLISNGTPGGTISADMTADIAVTLGSAEAADFSLSVTDVSFPAGSAHNSTLPINVDIINDRLLETDDTLTLGLVLTSALGTATGTHVVAIVDDETATIGFGSASSNIGEAAGSSSVPLNLVITGSGSGAAQLEAPLSVQISNTPGTASTPADYTVTTSDVGFAAGAPSPVVGTVVSTINNDVLVEGNEGFTLGLGAITGPTSVTATGTHAISIVDNDSASVAFSIAAADAPEAIGTYTANAVLDLVTDGVGTPALQSTAVVTLDTAGSTATVGTDFSVSVPSISFGPADADGAIRAIAIGIIADAIDESDETIDLGLTSTAPTLSVGTPGRQLITIRDDETAGILVTPTTLVVNEAGATSDTYTVVLGSQPAAAVQIDLAFTAAQISVNGDTDGVYALTFTPANWSVAQTVTVTAIDDVMIEGAHTVNIVQTSTTTDPQYAVINPDDVVVNITDNDIAGVTLNLIGTTLDEAAPAATASYSAMLNTQPTADVTIAASFDAANVVINGESDGSAALTFTAANWNIPQTFTVSVINDAIDEAIGATYTTLVSNSVSSTDANYANATAAPFAPSAAVTLTITENDNAGITTVQTAGSTDVTEGGASDTYSVVLTSEPTANVVLNVVGTQVGVNPAPLTFTTTNWNVAQTVTVNAIDDFVFEGPHSGSIATTINSGDGFYHALGVPTLAVNITDNDSNGVVVVQSAGTTQVIEGGTTDSYTLALNSQPSADVVVTISPDAQLSATPTTLTFTASNWNVPQTVDVAAVKDPVIEGNHTGVITHAAASADANYNGLVLASITVSITDNDSAGILLNLINTTLNEAAPATTASYSAVLNAQPTADVTITANFDAGNVLINGESDGSAAVVFTAVNWNTPQTFVISVINDDVDETAGPSYTSLVSNVVSSADPNFANNAAAPFAPSDVVTLTIAENDVIGAIAVESAGATAVVEGGIGDTYTLALTSQPLADVIVTLVPDAQLSVAPTSLTFTSANWNIAQTVSVSAVDDLLVEGNHVGSIAYTIASADPAFANLVIAPISIAIGDNDDIIAVPTLDWRGLTLLIALFGMFAAAGLRRRLL